MDTKKKNPSALQTVLIVALVLVIVFLPQVTAFIGSLYDTAMCSIIGPSYPLC